MHRRNFLRTSMAAISAAVGGGAVLGTRSRAEAKSYPVSMTDDQWRKRLTPDQFAVLRQEATERPFTSPLTENKKSGRYACAGCDTPAYSSETKFDSGTGWPSFWAPLSASVVDTKTDRKLLYARTEVHCATCGGHLGHIFDDGPKPTGKRHCLNGVALKFMPGAPSAS